MGFRYQNVFVSWFLLEERKIWEWKVRPGNQGAVLLLQEPSTAPGDLRSEEKVKPQRHTLLPKARGRRAAALPGLSVGAGGVSPHPVPARPRGPALPAAGSGGGRGSQAAVRAGPR